MKKLLSLMGAITMSASTASAVVACGNKVAPENPSKPDEGFETEARQDTISKLMSQYSKTLFLNQNALSDNETHFSSKYYMDNNVKNEYLKDLGLTKFDESENVESNAKFNTIASKYFNVNNMLASDLKLSDNVYQDYVLDPGVEDEGIVDAIKNTIPQVLGFLSDPAQLQQLIAAVAQNPAMIESIVSPELLKTIGNVLNQDALQALENAFSNDLYKDMSYQTALNSSVIGLSNAINKIIDGKGAEKLSYASQQDIDDNISSATSTLVDKMKSIMDGEVELKVDFLENIDSIAEVIRFVRTLLVYLEQFSYDEMTSSVLTLEIIEVKRSRIVDTNQIDIKQIFKKLNFMVNNDETGIVFKNYIGALFVTNSKNFSVTKDFTEKVNDGLMGILSKFAIKAMGQDKINAGFFNIYVNALVRSFINGGINKEYGGTLFSTVIGLIFTVQGMLPSPVKEIISKIKDNGDADKFKEDWMGYLWNNSNTKLNFSIKDLLTVPMNQISLSGLTENSEEDVEQNEEEQKRFNEAKPSSMDFITNKSLKEIVNDLDSAFSQTTNSTLNFNDLGELISRLKKDSTLENALKDINNMFEVLGMNSDGTVKEGSVFEQFFKILESNKEIFSQTGNVLSKWKDENDEKISALKTEAINLFKRISVVIKRNAINDFEYTVTDGTVENVFNIILKYNKNSKLEIGEIKLLVH
ncbi:lipoprotein [Spiroplasma diminutum]|uniref:MOLPALP family lipoprotein n=1 Tax=Spiroplasma diminutum CUAS-1 TaxID=1276221 RepID=S5MJQ2_9MOLU|nr:lipoprotein [Spiroplasma diminutum]AGR42180.1 hypothetical protein SDIMI_v3c04760 [Spiroplasma diminutum CUAS-1]